MEAPLFYIAAVCIFASFVTLDVCLGGEQTEGNTITFYYEPKQKYFVAMTHSKCYMVRVTLEESDHAHTNQGMEDLEIKMVHDWLGKLNETKVLHNDPNLPNYIHHWCSHRDIYLLERTLPVDPSASSTPIV